MRVLSKQGLGSGLGECISGFSGQVCVHIFQVFSHGDVSLSNQISLGFEISTADGQNPALPIIRNIP